MDFGQDTCSLSALVFLFCGAVNWEIPPFFCNRKRSPRSITAASHSHAEILSADIDGIQTVLFASLRSLCPGWERCSQTKVMRSPARIGIADTKEWAVLYYKSFSLLGASHAFCYFFVCFLVSSRCWRAAIEASTDWVLVGVLEQASKCLSIYWSQFLLFYVLLRLLMKSSNCCTVC